MTNYQIKRTKNLLSLSDIIMKCAWNVR